MSGGIMSRVIEEAKRPSVEARTESYEMVNVRPGEKVSALLDLMSRLAGISPSAMMADRLSIALADYAASSAAHGPAILAAAAAALEDDGGFWDDCALGLLSKRGVIETKDLTMEAMWGSASKKKPQEP